MSEVLGFKTKRLPVPEPVDFEAGFSLLEVLIVLAIMGLILSLVGVRLVNSIDGTRFSKQSEATLADVKLFRAQAMLDKHPLIILTTDNTVDLQTWPQNFHRRFDIPKGWTVSGEPIKISEGGICYGGAVKISNSNGRSARYILSPPRCELNRVTENIDRPDNAY